MTVEKSKMLTGQLYNASDPVLVQEREAAHGICHRYNRLPNASSDRANLLSQLLGRIGKNCLIEPPFFCDYGYNVSLGDDVYFNCNCIILDCATVCIGNGVKFGPNVQIYTAGHPTDPGDRRKGLEFARPIEIEENVWVGGGSIVLPGVRIGQDTVIGAGSVVTHPIPAGVIAVGNPCRVLKAI